MQTEQIGSKAECNKATKRLTRALARALARLSCRLKRRWWLCSEPLYCSQEGWRGPFQPLTAASEGPTGADRPLPDVCC